MNCNNKNRVVFINHPKTIFSMRLLCLDIYIPRIAQILDITNETHFPKVALDPICRSGTVIYDNKRLFITFLIATGRV